MNGSSERVTEDFFKFLLTFAFTCEIVDFYYIIRLFEKM